MNNITNYDKINKKVLYMLFIISLLTVIILFISFFSFADDMEFYKSSEHVNGLIKNKENKHGKKVIRVSYKVKSKIYSNDIYVSDKEYTSLHTGDSLEIFYNSNNPIDCRMTTRSMGNVIFIIFLLLFIAISSFTLGILYYKSIRTNKQLIKDNITIDTTFYRLEFKNSIFGNEKVNYIYCKGTYNNENRIFKSVGFKFKPKPLNDKSIIKVYINDKGKYLVKIDDLYS